MNSLKKILWIKDFDDETRAIDYSIEEVVKKELIANDTYTPTKGDKLWFYPGCTIPRFKITQFCKKHNVAIVKTADKAVIKVISDGTIKELTRKVSMYSLPKSTFISCLDSVMCNAYIQLRNEALAFEEIHFSYHAASTFMDEETLGKSIVDKWEEFSYKDCIIPSSEKSSQQLIDILNSSNIYKEDALLSLLNSSIIMTESMYEETRKILESDDKENTKLAMEAMANCDFQKSAVYLLLLLREFGNKIHNSGASHHVNFKSLIKYFKITRLTNISLDDIINSLRSQKILNLANLNMLMPMAIEQIKEEGDMENIKVKDVELTPEMEASLEENILDQLPPVSEDTNTPETDDSHSALFAQTINAPLDSI